MTLCWPGDRQEMIDLFTVDWAEREGESEGRTDEGRVLERKEGGKEGGRKEGRKKERGMEGGIRAMEQHSMTRDIT